MSKPVCPECQFPLRYSALFLSQDQAYFAIPSHHDAAFRAICHHSNERLSDGIYGCASMREALQGLLPTKSVPTPPPLTEPVNTDVPSTPVPIRAIVERFQSLGDNCEFGLVQRWAEAEPLDLLRFAGFLIPVEHRLQRTIDALTAGFDGLGDPESIVCDLHGETPPREFMIGETRWMLFYHTGRHEGEIEPEQLRRQQTLSLQLRRRKLFEDLAEARRIFLWKSNVATSEEEVRHLVTCLRLYGPNLLLWVTTADTNHPAGLVEYLGNGLMRGCVDRFAPYEAAYDIDHGAWQSVCRNAAALADMLCRCDEWSHPDPNQSNPARPDKAPPLAEIELAEAATAIHWEERREETPRVGSVVLGTAAWAPTDREWFGQNPGSQDMRGALLRDIVLDSAQSMLLQGSHKIRETRYLIDNEESYRQVRMVVEGLRSIGAEKVAVIGFNRAFRNFYHWMTQSLPALDLTVGRLGADRCALVLPPLASWQEETLDLLGLGDVSRITVNDLSHHYYFPWAYYSEYLNGSASFFLSPRSLAVLDKMAIEVSQPLDSPPFIYVARSDTSNRQVTNEREVRDIVEARGFVSVVPGDISIKDQIRLFRGARMVIGTHGAGLTNISFCRPGTRVLELVQSTYANPSMNRIAQARGLDYHAECFESATGVDVHKQPWTVDIARLSRVVSTLSEGTR